MSWNYRVYKEINELGEVALTIRAHYTTEDGFGFGELPEHPQGETVSELRYDLERMLDACDKPVLDYED
jgi:hypothetical protein